MNGNLDSLVSSLDKISPENNNGDIPPSNFLHEFSTKYADNAVEHETKGISRVQNDMESNSNDLKQMTNSSSNSNFPHFNHYQHYLNNDKKFKNYKLISDPFLKKGAQKLYRYDGVITAVNSNPQLFYIF